MKKLNFYLYLIIFFISLSGISAASSFKEGKELFESNNVEEAVIYFEEALITKPTGDVYKYLAESYNILGMPDDEILVLEEAISEDVGDMSYFNFKLGNAYQLAGDYNGALKCFLNVITINKDYVNETFLNIANVSVELKQYSSAIDNYSKYLELVPESTQKRKIVKMIFVLKKLQKEELEKQAEANKLEEAERLAKEEEALRLEEERLNETAMNQQLQEEREAKARALEEERLLYDNESQQYQEELANFRDAEGKVVNPPDPDIEAWRKLLEQKEQELAEREKTNSGSRGGSQVVRRGCIRI